MKTKNFGNLAFFALLYLALMAAAYWYFNRPKAENTNLGANTVNSVNLNNKFNNSASNNRIGSDGLANQGLNTDALNPAQNNSSVTAVDIPLSNAQAVTNTEANQNVINSRARQLHDNSFYANKTWRATINYPVDGDLVNGENGWVNLHGQVNQSRLGERLFVVVESTTQDPPMIYLQRELQLADDGFWTANVKFGSIGYQYLTYVISAENEVAAEAIRQLGEFTQAQIPLGVEIISKPNLNLIQ